MSWFARAFRPGQGERTSPGLGPRNGGYEEALSRASMVEAVIGAARGPETLGICPIPGSAVVAPKRMLRGMREECMVMRMEKTCSMKKRKKRKGY